MSMSGVTWGLPVCLVDLGCGSKRPDTYTPPIPDAPVPHSDPDNTHATKISQLTAELEDLKRDRAEVWDAWHDSMRKIDAIRLENTQLRNERSASHDRGREQALAEVRQILIDEMDAVSNTQRTLRTLDLTIGKSDPLEAASTALLLVRDRIQRLIDEGIPF